jgi:hypothetical protein
MAAVIVPVYCTMGTIRVERRLTTEHPKAGSVEPVVLNSRRSITLEIDAVSVVSIEEEDEVDVGGDYTLCDACEFCEDVCDRADCLRCGPSQSASLAAAVEPLRSCYTMCQVRRHNHMGSAWLVAGDVIYDATPYLQSHPGGAECILRKAGGRQDCRRDLEFHSARGKQLFKKHVIGKVRSCPGCSLYQVAKSDKLKWFLW